jgi:hypothetical protein
MRNVDIVPCPHDLKSRMGLLFLWGRWGGARFCFARVRDNVDIPPDLQIARNQFKTKSWSRRRAMVGPVKIANK